MAKGKDVCAHLGCTRAGDYSSVLYEEIEQGVHRPISTLHYCAEHLPRIPWQRDLSTFMQDRGLAALANNWEGR